MTEIRQGPLAWGQQLIWLFDRMSSGSDTTLLVSFSDVPLPASIDVDGVLAAVDALVARHEALRTTFFVDRLGTPSQVVQDFDRRRYEYHVVPEADNDWLGQPFDLSEDWPVRLEVIGTAEQPTRARLAVHVLVMDHHANEALLADLHELLEAGSQHRQPDLPATIWHPLDIAELESTPFGVRENQRALEYWEKGLAVVPNSPFPGAREQAPGDGRISVRLNSRRCRLAVAELAEALRVTEPTVLTAVSSLALVVATGSPEYAMTFVAPNRTRQGMRESVCAMSDRALLTGIVEPGTSFRALIPRIEAASLRGYKHSHYVPGAMRLITAEVAVRRGIYLHRLPRLNILPGSAMTPPDEEDGPETFDTSTSPAPFDGVHLIVEMLARELQVTLRAGDHILSAAENESFVRTWERLLLAARDDPDAALSDPATAPAGQVVDHCRIDSDAITDVLCGLERVEHAAVFVAGEPARLHAFIVTQDPHATPAALRAELFPLLGNRPGLMCPHEFAVCRHKSDDPASYDSWLRVDTVHNGSGWPRESLPPRTDEENCLALAFARTHPETRPESADAGLSYLAAGGQFERIPTFLGQVKELGYAGINADDVLGWHSIETLAGKLEPAQQERGSS